LTTSLTGSFTPVVYDNSSITYEWSLVSGSGTATFTGNTATSTGVTVSQCGTYTFKYKVINQACNAETTITIEFFETPAPVINGASNVFACAQETYTVTDARVCTYGSVVNTWAVVGGVFEPGGLATATGNSVTVAWDNTITTGSLQLVSSYVGLSSCITTTPVFNVTKVAPTLAGQVKYWNEFETYMPTPFPTDLYGTFPHDYFYVTLYRQGTTLDSLQTVKVEPRLQPDLIELLSYFKFDIPVGSLGCDNEYLVKIWDGGLSYHRFVGGTPTPPVSGTYLGEAFTYTNWGGVNATDALAIQLMVGSAFQLNEAPYNFTWLGPKTETPPYGYFSHSIADVNSSKTYQAGGITALDALTTNYRAVGLIASFPNATPGVQFSPNFRVTGRMVPSLPYSTWPLYFDYPTATTHVDDVPFYHSGTSYLYFTGAEQHKYSSTALPIESKNNFMNIYYNAIGDINSSYVPEAETFKTQSDVTLTFDKVAKATVGDIIYLPVRVDQSMELGAISFGISYRKDLIEVVATDYQADFVRIDHNQGNVRLGWYNTEGVRLNANDNIIVLTVKVLAEIGEETNLFTLDPTTELADISANVIHNIELRSTAIETVGKADAEISCSNYPNPFVNNTTITYSLPQSGNVQLVVYDKLGQVVSVLVNEEQSAGTHNVIAYRAELAAGVYHYKVTLNANGETYSVTKTMVVIE
jgi:hypothetical protein